jgi:amino acid adenylation domain-containing protein
MNFSNISHSLDFSNILLNPSTKKRTINSKNKNGLLKFELKNFKFSYCNDIDEFSYINSTVYFCSIISLLLSSLSRNNKVGFKLAKENWVSSQENLFISTNLDGASTFKDLVSLVQSSLNNRIFLAKKDNQTTFPLDICVSFVDKSEKLESDSKNLLLDEGVKIHFVFLKSNEICLVNIYYDNTIIDHRLIDSIQLVIENIIVKSFNKSDLMLEDPELFYNKDQASTDDPKILKYDHILNAFNENVINKNNNLCSSSIDNSLTYEEVNNLSNKVCSFLKAQKVAVGERINVLVDRSYFFIPVILGIWKARCSVVPIDIRLHKRRKETIIRETNAPLTIEINHDEEISLLNSYKIADIIISHNADMLSEKYQLSDEAYVVFTSGSTGTPKGVSISHKNIAHYSYSLLSHINLQKDKHYNFAVVSSLSADLANTCIYPALVHGSNTNFFTYEHSVDVDLFNSALKSNNIDIIKIVPTHFSGLLKLEKNFYSSLKLLIFGGEKLDMTLVQKIYKLNPSLIIYNHYGPSETTVGVFMTECDYKSKLTEAPIGFSLGDTSYFIIDHKNRLIPQNFIGELVVQGTNVSNGYINSKKNSNFISLFQKQSYKTGDIVFTGRSNELYFYFREDFQYKINGIRIDLSEIKYALKQLSIIHDYYIYFWNSKIYLFICNFNTQENERIRKELIKFLPSYLLPEIIALKKLPLNLNGKIDNEKLKKVIFNKTKIIKSALSPSDQKLLQIWNSHIGEMYSPDDTIYQYGANSLKATKFLHAISTALDIKINLGTFMKLPTFNNLKKIISSTSFINDAVNATITTSKKNSLTLFQERMWRVNQIFPEDASYNILILLDINDEILSSEIKEGVETIFNHFKVLRTRFNYDKEALTQDFDLKFETIFKQCKSKKELLDTYDFYKNEGINLVNSPPFLIFSYDKLLLIVLHHIITDRISNDLLLRCFDELLTKNSDFLKRCKKEGPHVQHLKGTDNLYPIKKLFWEKRLQNVRRLEWPKPENITKKLSPINHISFKKDLAQSIIVLAQNNRVSINVLFFSIINLAISYVCNTSSFHSLTAISKRETLNDFNSFGPAIDTMITKIDIDPESTFKQYIKSFNESYAENIEHSQIDFGEISKIGSLYGLDGKSNINVMYNYEEYFSPFRSFKRVKYKKSDTKFDLTTIVKEGKKSFTIEFIILESLGSKLFENLKNAVQSIVSEVISDDNIFLKKIPFKKHQEVVVKQTEFRQLYVEKFKEIVNKYPNNCCIEEGKEALTYTQIDELSDKMALNFIRKNIFDCPIVLVLPRGIKFLVAVLGVLKSKNYYIPLDPSSPKNRISRIIDTANANIIIDEKNYDSFVTNYSSYQVYKIKEISSDNPLVYMIFTSGSTGVPKGVPISNNSLMNYLLWAGVTYSFTSETTVAFLTSISYDLTITSYLLPLLHGSKIVVFDSLSNMKAIKGFIKYKNNINFLKITPSHLKIIQNSYPDYQLQISTLVIGGEALYYEDLKNIHNDVTIYNEYGPTETTVGCIYNKVARPSSKYYGKVPIGIPIDNTYCIIKGIYGQEVLPGVSGYLLIGGIGLFKGYFQSNLSPTEHIHFTNFNFYNSQDLAIFYNEEFIYLGRDDGQIKIHGHRVNVEEIENCLKEIELIKTAQIFYVSYNKEKKLVAIISLDRENTNYIKIINSHLQSILPHHMIPEYYIQNKHIILSDSGKINWNQSLDSLEYNDIKEIEKDTQDDLQEIKRKVHKMWQEILSQKDLININSNFFDIGGDSIKIFKLHSRINSEYKIKITLLDLFRYTSIERQALLIEKNIVSTL